MTKLWVDPASGWQFGFPKIYDDQVDGGLVDWLVSNGCPKDSLGYIRSWPVEEGETDND